MLVATIWLYVCSTSVVADYFVGLLEDDYPARAMSVVPEAEMIVLLGGATRGYAHAATTPDLNQYADRLVHAVALYKAEKSPRILLSGGRLENAQSEAQQMQDILQIMGVPPAALILEERSRDTYENARYSAQLLRQMDIGQVLLVTSAFHMRRAEAVFRAQGVSVIPAPTDHKRLVASRILPRWTPSTGNLARTSNAIHEFVGYSVYRYRGWIQ
jgi:uncharacterized SAM-binding protein YcdF (DUF218 family)